MKENNEITDLFRSRLGGAEMDVRDGFWEALQRDLPKAEAAPETKRVFLFPGFHRVAAAASVLLILGAASAAFWYFSPKEEIKEAFTQVAAFTPEGSLNGDIVQESFPSIHQADPVAQKPGHRLPTNVAPLAPGVPTDEEDESVSVRVSITITQRVYGNRQQTGNGYYANNQGGYQTVSDHASGQDAGSVTPVQEEVAETVSPSVASARRKWALNAALGTSLPKGDFHAPLTGELTLERQLSKRLSLEAGLQYNYLSVSGVGNDDLHTLAVPVKLNILLASSSKVDLYATVGGAAEKTLNKGFGEDPIRLSALAGLGVCYKMNDRFALFAEPSVSHHFDTDSNVRSLRSERATNMNLLCGVRMNY